MPIARTATTATLSARQRGPNTACALALLLAIPARAYAARVPLADRNDAFVGYAERSHPGGTAPCVDRDEACQNWANGGECDRNPNYMLASCARACKVCGSNGGATGGKSCHLEGEDAGELVLSVRLGEGGSSSERHIRIRLYPGVSPSAVASLFARSQQGGCSFYRAEPPPQPGAVDNYGGPGPPYGLVQGSLSGLQARGDSTVGNPTCRPPPLRRGSVAAINGGPDFMVCVSDHPEWDRAFVQFGEVADAESLDVVDAIVRLPSHGETWGATRTVVLDHRLACSAIASRARL